MISKFQDKTSFKKNIITVYSGEFRKFCRTPLNGCFCLTLRGNKFYKFIKVQARFLKRRFGIFVTAFWVIRSVYFVVIFNFKQLLGDQLQILLRNKANFSKLVFLQKLSESLRYFVDFRGNKSDIIRLNSLDIQRKIGGQSLTQQELLAV